MGQSQSYDALVACHDNMDKHWLDIKRKCYSEMRRLAESAALAARRKPGREPSITFHTMDINLPTKPDIFDMGNWYIQKHFQFYDVIFLPDCGGQWFDTQCEAGMNCEDLLPLLVPSLFMLKPGGYLYVGKLIHESCKHADLVEFLKQQEVVLDASVAYINVSGSADISVPHVKIQKRAAN